MLEELANYGKIEVITGYDVGETETKTVANDLQSYIVDVGSMAGEKDEGLLFGGGEGSAGTETHDFFGGDVDALMVGSCKSLHTKVVCSLFPC